ncbi:MAG: terminase large subunit, partial [Oscillospiraceae bacterium]
MDNLGKYNIILKARQQGFSTVAAAYSLYIACTKPNSSCLLMSYSIDSATAIFDKLKQLYNDLPNFAKSPLIANNKKELKFINGSRIVVCTCGNKDNARGMSLAFCHISEIAFFKDN